jgi:colicin import membrane protein
VSVAVFERRVDPGQIQSVVLAVLVHVLLALTLVLGVRWQNRPPESVSVELWEPPVEQPAPRVEPPPPPPQAVVPPKPEPVIEKPDIALKAPPKPKPVPKPEPKAEPKPIPKPVAKPKPPSDAEAQKRLREELARDLAAFAKQNEQQDTKARQAREAAAVNLAALKVWEAKVGQLIRGRIQSEIAQAVPGNPQAVVKVTLLPSYEVREYSFQTRTGNAAYDEQIESALKYFQKTPLPRPDKPELVEDELRRNRRELILTFRPKER